MWTCGAAGISCSCEELDRTGGLSRSHQGEILPTTEPVPVPQTLLWTMYNTVSLKLQYMK